MTIPAPTEAATYLSKNSILAVSYVRQCSLFNFQRSAQVFISSGFILSRASMATAVVSVAVFIFRTRLCAVRSLPAQTEHWDKAAQNRGWSGESHAPADQMSENGKSTQTIRTYIVLCPHITNKRDASGFAFNFLFLFVINQADLICFGMTLTRPSRQPR
jgi:hypothetical protein